MPGFLVKGQTLLMFKAYGFDTAPVLRMKPTGLDHGCEVNVLTSGYHEWSRGRERERASLF